MTSTFTTNLNLNLQGTGDNVGTWGGVLNTGVFAILDAALGNVQTLTLSSSDITVTTTQSQVATIILTGTLTANVNVIFPAIGRTYFVINNCTGAFTTTLKIGAGATAISPQGAGQFFVLDGTNVNRTTTPGFGALTSVASAATVNLGAVASNLISITGTTAITSFGSSATLSAPLYEVTFAGALTLTYNATSLILPGAQNIQTSAGDVATILYLGSGNWRVVDYVYARSTPAVPVFGQCQFTRTSASVVTLLPYQGHFVSFPSGSIATIPSAGVAATITNLYINGVPAQSLSATTLYYAYLWLNAGVPTLDFSTTGHVTDSTTGIEIKNGDATRVLIGMVYPAVGPVFNDTPAARTVATWFNRRSRSFSGAFSVNRTASASSTLSEINTEIRSTFVTWGGDNIMAAYAGGASSSSSTGGGLVGGPSLDGGAPQFVEGANPVTSNNYTNVSVSGVINGAAEGFHYLTYLAYCTNGTGTWLVLNNQGVLSGVILS